MTTIRTSLLLAGMIGVASLVVAPVSTAASPGMGWDVFYTGEGESITTDSSSYQSPAAGQGFDLFNTGDGVRVDDFMPSYQGTAMGSEPRGGWDVFGIGDGEPLP